MICGCSCHSPVVTVVIIVAAVVHLVVVIAVVVAVVAVLVVMEKCPARGFAKYTVIGIVDKRCASPS